MSDDVTRYPSPRILRYKHSRKHACVFLILKCRHDHEHGVTLRLCQRVRLFECSLKELHFSFSGVDRIKMTPYIFILFSVPLLLGTNTETARILALQTFPGKSHIGAYQPLFEELARRGHEVTFVSAYPKKKQLANYKEIELEDTLPSRGSKDFNFFKIGQTPFFINVFFRHNIMIDSCEKVLLQPNMQKFIHSTDLQFDLIIYEPFMTQCTYGLLHKFKAPSVQIVPNTIVPFMTDSMGNPSTASYIPGTHIENETMGFFGRLSNILLNLYMKLINHFFIKPKMDAVLRKHFPDPSLPSIHELETNASLLLLHSHPFLHHPRPLTPNTIEVGGLHIKAMQNLPQELKKFLDAAAHGAIYFSLGSNVRSVDMPEEMLNAILKSFSKLKQKVLWKWEADNLPGQPANVRLGKWLPQHDILAHPNVKLFVTHGGLMSLQEATHFGVPMVAIPVAADQKFNAKVVQNRGIGVVLDVQNITEASLDWALHEVLHESRYHEAAKQASKIFQDQPQTPMDRAVFWIEYTIRHKGAAHMRSAALDLNIFQYYFLDVIAVLLFLVLATIFITVLTARLVIRRLCTKNVKHFKNKSEKKKKLK